MLYSRRPAAAALATTLLCHLLGASAAVHSPKSMWIQAAELVPEGSAVPNGRWWHLGGTAAEHSERLGQVCDHHLEAGDVHMDPAAYPDLGQGCVAVWVADHGDPFTAVHLPTDQQDNFLNTLHYEKALLFSDDNMGLRSGSLPIPGVDWHPTCYIADLDIDGTTRRVLGYEETNGDKLAPCPGSREGLHFSEAQISDADDEELQVMCNACYQSVCSGDFQQDPRLCASNNDGGVDIGAASDEAHLVRQVSSSYHCHLTMADEGACDFVHWDQHVESRDYLMESGVLCGWERVRELQITHCDCTKEAGNANGCGEQECVDMALSGVVCGNCDNGAGCNQGRAYEGVFEMTGMPDANEGTCGHALKMKKQHGEDSPQFYEAKRLCVKGLHCRSEYANGGMVNSQDSLTSEGCVYYCGLYGEDDPERCDAARRRSLLELGEVFEIEQAEDASIPFSAIRGNPIPRRAGGAF